MYPCADIIKSTFSLHHTAEPAFRTQEVGCAVGIPRLVNPTLLWRETREGVVNRHNRLTEWDLITRMGRR